MELSDASLVHKDVTDRILNAAIEVHRALGPGLLESTYELVEGKVIVEAKSIDKLAPIHTAQLLTYLRLADKQVGMLINFNVELLIDGVVRRVLSNPNRSSALSACSAVNGALEEARTHP